jgi:hypothetical protein
MGFEDEGPSLFELGGDKGGAVHIESGVGIVLLRVALLFHNDAMTYAEIELHNI